MNGEGASMGQTQPQPPHDRYMTPSAAEPVGTVMTSTPIAVLPTDSLRTAAKKLWSHSVGIVLVGDPAQPIGILMSERDIVTALGNGADPDITTAGQAMTTSVVSVHSDDRVFDVALQMLDDAVRHMPVADDDRVIGVVSLRDLVRPLVLAALTPPPAS